jgi:glycosyltransferase involved in cell wall biosynthesis
VPVPEHVAVNALFLAPGVSGGPETYVRGLLPALAAQFPNLRLTIFSTRSGSALLEQLGFGDFANLVAMPCEDGMRLRRTLAEQVLLPRAARRAGAQLLHSLASTAPVRARMRTVITLHDVTFLRIRTFGSLTTLGLRFIVAHAARRADVLVSVTAAARDDVAAELRLDPARFVVVHHGRGRARAQPSASEAQMRARFQLDGKRVVLCVGAKRPHKNQAVLLAAARELDDDVVLVLVGHAEPYEASLRTLAAELAITDRVRFVDPLSDGELEALWRVAGCFAFPTLGEGFGLPLLEALDHGVGVACSDLPVLREVGGDLPVYFDPRSPSAAATAIEAVLADPARAARGPAHAAAFSWERAARETYAAYERALA